MSKSGWQQLAQTITRGDAVIMVSVIEVRGSASAKTGSRLILDHEGKILSGWIGGGCIESLVQQEAQEALLEQKARLVEVDLDAESFVDGIPCGGRMQIYIDPIIPVPILYVINCPSIDEELSWLARLLGYEVQKLTVDDPRIPALSEDKFASNHFLLYGMHSKDTEKLFELVQQFPGASLGLEEKTTGPVSLIRGDRDVLSLPGDATRYTAISVMSYLIARRAGHCRSPLPEELAILAAMVTPGQSQLWLVGGGEINRALSTLAANLGWHVREWQVSSGDNKCISHGLEQLETEAFPEGLFAVIAGQHKDDHLVSAKLLTMGAAYVGLVASKKRARLTMNYLREYLLAQTLLTRFHSPVGLGIAACGPAEIALSIMGDLLLQCPAAECSKPDKVAMNHSS